jgi:hypothetical protein
LSCGVVYWRDLLIRSGRCLFCNDDKRWADPSKLKRHIESHFKNLQDGSVSCHHRLCYEHHSTKDDLKLHLLSAHGIEMGSKSSRGTKRTSLGSENMEDDMYQGENLTEEQLEWCSDESSSC